MRARIIAEAGSNHCGDIGIASQMVRQAAACGADYIKFQSWQSKNLKPGDPNHERHALAELSDEAHHILIDECKKRGIEFLTSCFDINRADFLAGLGLESIKIPSTEFTSLRMIRMLKERFNHLMLSTGAVTDNELEETIAILKGHRFTLLHCVSIYPLPAEKANLARMSRLRAYTPSVGFSDHSLGPDLAKAAIAMGAEYIEKHFTIDRTLPGRDQAISSGPDVIRDIAEYAKYFEKAYGKERYRISAQESAVRREYTGKWGNNR